MEIQDNSVDTYYQVYKYQYHRSCDKTEKVFIIIFAHTIVQPLAVMIKIIYTSITLLAMF